MAKAKLSDFLRGLTRGMKAETMGDLSDRQLVERFLVEQDEAVFEAMVRRHGPMVYRVCWRILQQDQDSEDAFQATFLLLAQNLRTLRKRTSLASWLHGVAHRVALKAKSQCATRRRHEQQASLSKAKVSEEVNWEEVRAALDAELARLPEKWRLPLILCYLESRTQDEAAAHLGWSKNTLRRRLDEARTALGRRLVRRGVFPAALSAVLLSDCVAPAAIAPGLIASTVSAAAYIAAGQMATAFISANVAVLMKGVGIAMSLKKTKFVLLWVLALVLVGGTGMLTYNASAGPVAVEEQTRAAKVQKQAPVQKQSPPKQKPGKAAAKLAGDWIMVLPAGFTHNMHIRRINPRRYLFTKAVRFSGFYELRKNRLVLVQPATRNEGPFEWELRKTGDLVLVVQPPVAKTGSNYLGATLIRLPKDDNKEKQGKQPQPDAKQNQAKGGRQPMDTQLIQGVWNKDGKLEGETQWWDTNGKLLSKGVYKSDRPWNGVFPELKDRVGWMLRTYRDGKMIHEEKLTAPWWY